jgi:hypothetical protein
LLPLLQRSGIGVEQGVLALLGGLGEAQLRLGGAVGRQRRNQVVLRLRELHGFDGKQRLALPDLVAGIGHDPRHATGQGRKHRRGAVPVQGDLAVGELLVTEVHAGCGGERQRRHLCRRGPERARRGRRGPGGGGRGGKNAYPGHCASQHGGHGEYDDNLLADRQADALQNGSRSGISAPQG